jgi:hypothetical protein
MQAAHWARIAPERDLVRRSCRCSVRRCRGRHRWAAAGSGEPGDRPHDRGPRTERKRARDIGRVSSRGSLDSQIVRIRSNAQRRRPTPTAPAVLTQAQEVPAGAGSGHLHRRGAHRPIATLPKQVDAASELCTARSAAPAATLSNRLGPRACRIDRFVVDSSRSHPPYGVAGFGHLWAHARLLLSVQSAHWMQRSPGCPPDRFSQSASFLQVKQATSLLKLAQKA